MRNSCWPRILVLLWTNGHSAPHRGRHCSSTSRYHSAHQAAQSIDWKYVRMLETVCALADSVLRRVFGLIRLLDIQAFNRSRASDFVGLSLTARFFGPL